MLTSGSQFGTGSDKQFSDVGIAYSHAYTMLGAETLSDGTRLVHMRNPWGHEIYKGNWSDASELWTDEFKEEVSLEEKNDGIFFISIEDYFTEFQATWVNWPTEEMHEAHFLVIDDQSDSPGELAYCG